MPGTGETSPLREAAAVHWSRALEPPSSSARAGSHPGATIRRKRAIKGLSFPLRTKLVPWAQFQHPGSATAARAGSWRAEFPCPHGAPMIQLPTGWAARLMAVLFLTGREGLNARCEFQSLWLEPGTGRMSSRYPRASLGWVQALWGTADRAWLTGLPRSKGTRLSSRQP